MSPLFLTIIAYLLGSIPFGVIVAKQYGGRDITREGSGNIGATNVGRVIGKKAGILTLAGDSLKGVVPILLVMLIHGRLPWLISIVALAAFMGHIYPVFNNFKGGKGVATALGIFLVISPSAAICALVIFIITLAIWRYVSLGSVVAAGVMPGLIGIFTDSSLYIIAATIIGSIVIYRHRDNIGRLLRGEENRFGAKKGDEVNDESSDQ